MADEDVKARLRQLILGTDLSKTTGDQNHTCHDGSDTCNKKILCASLTRSHCPLSEKMLRKSLEEEMGVDLSEKKLLIRAEVRAS